MPPPSTPRPEPSPRVAITGASGLVGTALVRFLAREGYRPVRLVRSRERAGEDAVYWSPSEGEIDADALEGVSAVVHLAGENLAAGRWTEARKERILQSRVQGTRLLSGALARLGERPPVLVSASAVEIYAQHGDRPLDESEPSGEGFLAEVCREWEAATAEASQAGIRVVNLRLGLVLSPEGGVLGRLLPVFRLGLGGKLGSGRQYMSWIALGDLVRVVQHVIGESRLEGPVNAVSPQPVTNAEFTETLARVLGRPAGLPVPGAALRLAFGREFADGALLEGRRAVPARLADTGFEWRHPELESALRHLLDR